jgi:integrase
VRRPVRHHDTGRRSVLFAWPVLPDETRHTLVCKALEPLWRGRVETASRVRGRIEAVLNWARMRGYRTGENPARWKGHLSNLLPARSKVAATKHHAALPYDQVPAFITELRQHGGATARALES